MQSCSFETLSAAEESAQAKLLGEPTEPADPASQGRDQPIDRDHESVLLKPLDATCADQADHPGTAPRKHHRRRRRDSHAAWSRTRASDREPDAGRIANESMSPRPCHGSE
jgi:hypothetical protein